MNQRNDSMDDQTFVWVFFALIIIFAVPWIYSAKAAYINDILLSMSLLQIKAFRPISAEIDVATAYISQLDPATLTWEQMEGVLRYSGKWIRWPWLFMLILLGVTAILMGKTGSLVRRFNMDTLLQNNSRSFACLKPVVGRGEYLLSPGSYDSGRWRVARTPLQFALEHELLLGTDGRPIDEDQVLKNGLATTGSDAYGHLQLDGTKALKVLKEQLGPVFSGFENLSSCRRAVAAAFLAYASGDKKCCTAILDTVSCSYIEVDGVASCPVLEQEGFSRKLITTWNKAENILEEGIFKRHSAFEIPWFMALLNRARQKGVLASSQFLWIRPLDRPLWYALNQCGGRTAWAEAFAPWAHYMAEEREGTALSEPRLAQAVICLRDALDAQGWLAEDPIPTSSSIISPIQGEDASQTIPKQHHVYAVAEVDPEYDVDDDPVIQDQLY